MNANEHELGGSIRVHSWLENYSPNCANFNLSSTKVRLLPSEKAVLQDTVTPSLDSPRDFRTPIPTKDRNIVTATAPNFLL
jgi:hypothetical protein